jgi:hypothetical protein
MAQPGYLEGNQLVVQLAALIIRRPVHFGDVSTGWPLELGAQLDKWGWSRGREKGRGTYHPGVQGNG